MAGIADLRTLMKKAKNKAHSLKSKGLSRPALETWRNKAIAESQKGYGNHDADNIHRLVREYHRNFMGK